MKTPILPFALVGIAIYTLSRKDKKLTKSNNQFYFSKDCKTLTILDKEKAGLYFYTQATNKSLKELKEKLCKADDLEPTVSNYENFYNVISINITRSIYDKDSYLGLLLLVYEYLSFLAISEENNLKTNLIHPYDVKYVNINKGFTLNIKGDDLTIISLPETLDFFRKIGSKALILKQSLMKKGLSEEEIEEYLIGIFEILSYGSELNFIFNETYYLMFRAYLQGLVESTALDKVKANEILMNVRDEFKKNGVDTNSFPQGVD